MKTFPELFSHAAEVAGDVSIYCPDGITTYSEIEVETRKVATGLIKLGVRSGDRVGFWLPNLRAYLGLLGACGQIGAIAVAMNTRYRSAEIEDVLRRVQPKVIAFVPKLGRSDHIAILRDVDQSLLSKVSTFIQCDGEEVLDLQNLTSHSYFSLAQNEPLETPLSHSDSGFAIFNTSGTTSLPKFVLHNQKQVVGHASDVAEVLKMRTKNTMVLQSLPFCGVFGFIFLVSTIRAGAPFVMPTIFEAVESAKLIIDHKVTHAAGGDDMFSRLLEEGVRLTQDENIPFPDLKFCPYASFNSSLADFPEIASKKGIPLVGPYGMSEVFSFFSLRRMEDSAAIRTVGGGVPVNPNAKVRVRDPDTGKLLSYDEEGELEMWSPNIFVEYYGNKKASQEAFTGDGYLRTGDLGTISNDGSFTYLGRMGDVLRLGGFLVSPLEIETHLCSHRLVDDAQVVSVPTAKGNRPVAFILSNQSDNIEESELIDYCKKSLAGFKVPTRIFLIDTFPTTPSPNGTKIQKGELREMAIKNI